MTKILLPLLLAAVAVSFTTAKICWEECSGRPGRLVSVDIAGCHRRQGRNGRTPRFWCDGLQGPPCFLRQGDEAELTAVFETDLDLSHDVEHRIDWEMSSLMEMPWVGMDTDGCRYIVDPPCGDRGTPGQPRNVTIVYQMKVLDMYPTGFFPLKWKLTTTHDGERTEVTCFRFNLKIV